MIGLFLENRFFGCTGPLRHMLQACENQYKCKQSEGLFQTDKNIKEILIVEHNGPVT